MRRDQKLAKKKKARQQARAVARADSDLSPAKAATKPLGPCWLSRSWRDSELPPELVSVVITRDLGGVYVAHTLLVDRTCFGVKNAFTVGPLGHAELLEAVNRVGEAHVDGMESVSVEDAQSVVFAAVAYAKRLGFHPNRGFDARLVGPAPEPLRLTPLAARERPFVVPGSDDDVARTMAALRRAVGEHGFDFGSHDDDGYDEAEHDHEADRREDEGTIGRAIRTAFSVLALNGNPPEWEAALGHFLAPLGLDDHVLPPEHQTSLPSFWATLFRPLARGARGVDVLHTSRPHDTAFAALVETRAVLFEVLSVLGTIGICRDVITGKILRVRLGGVATLELPCDGDALWGKAHYLAEARARMRGPGTPEEVTAIFETLLARRATLYGDDLRVVGEWDLGPDGRGGHTFRCDARLPPS